MAKKSTTSDSTSAAKKTRQRTAHYYLVTLTQESEPILVLAANAKKAQAAIVTVRLAAPQDILNAGKHGYAIIDATTPAAKSAATESVADSYFKEVGE